MLKKWCSTYWLYAMYIIGTVLAILLALNWTVWSYEFRLMVFVPITLMLHVIEEWRIPGGFHYGYNLVFGSDCPNVYPMNTLVDMLTVFCGQLMFLAFLILAPNPGTMLGLAVFSYMEGVGHIAMAIFLYCKLKNKGKKTIYSPGFLTAVTVFLPAAILLTRELMGTTFSTGDWITFAVLLSGVFACVFVPDILFKSKTTPYAFPSARYFKRFE